ncbi:lytic transglycosylase domain-containing protein [Roseomonas marmotae]|uniref:Lytic transglycosylase domain-containing protein n=1 Tax=Roseomonas marmotae TaxID=2768161 RepID=A0ABS3KGJ2_9PROT|nr:lytic transglycosylase domain-containing protein [Roseomonas marmotae]MBO1076584.1 lytic transglycosylase domain-containing protein [Roseomonas marmotae]QTI79568.1 lytic transglycosylase domain-containing protein [Roseomonas marmotae]
MEELDLGAFARNALTSTIPASTVLSRRFRGLTGLLVLLPGLALADPPAEPSPITAPIPAATPSPAATSSVAATPSPAAGTLCLPAIAAAERSHKIPAHLLRSIAFVESGRTDPVTGRTVPWPWAINVGGKGYFHDTKEEAVEAVRGFQARGIRSIDVGCAQINLMHHPDAFASLEEAFDPKTNTSYAARFLRSLQGATRSWPMAAAGYHSQTPTLGFPYARKVMAIWPGSARYGTLPVPILGTETGTGAQTLAIPDIYTPEFAAKSRRIDEDLRRSGLRTRIDTRLEEVDLPSGRIRITLPAPRRVTQRDSR